MNDASTTGNTGSRPHRVPLVRVDGKQYTNGMLWDAERMVKEPTLLREMRDDIAREAERMFGFPPSLYFYVGHACPDFGADGNTFVFVFASEIFDDEPGSMTHFDTGGFYKGYIHLDSSVDPCEYVKLHRIDALLTWHNEFAQHIAAHFASASAYVRGDRATKNDTYGRLHHRSNKDRRAWTWELQLPRDHDVREGLVRLWITSEAQDRLNQVVMDLDDVGEKKRWRSITETSLRAPPATNEATTLCRAAEEEIASWL